MGPTAVPPSRRPALNATPPARSANVQVTDYAYDANGNLSLTTAPDGVITEDSYDPLGRLGFAANADSQIETANPRKLNRDSGVGFIAGTFLIRSESIHAARRKQAQTATMTMRRVNITSPAIRMALALSPRPFLFVHCATNLRLSPTGALCVHDELFRHSETPPG